MNDDFLESVTIHRALTRPNLFLGGDREVVMFSGLIAATLVFYALARRMYPVPLNPKWLLECFIGNVV